MEQPTVYNGESHAGISPCFYMCVCMSVRIIPSFERKMREQCVGNWVGSIGASRVYRLTSTFSREENACCFPLRPWPTVWIHCAFTGSLVQNPAPNPPCPLPTHQLGIHLLFWPFSSQQRNIKVGPGLVLCKKTEVSSQCEQQTAELVLLSVKKKNEVWVTVMKIRFN